jgi:galactokinase
MLSAPIHPTMNQTDEIVAKYRELFGAEPEFVVRAPGRVNLIGEHTDYNDGFVFPAAINYEVVMAGAPRADGQVRAYSAIFDESDTFAVDVAVPSEDARWSNYIRAVAFILNKEGHGLRGMNVAVTGTVPLASGLSSSAAMEIASCLAFEAAGGFAVDPVKRALIGQRAEREFVGVQVGIMDQFISANGRAHHALFIDTRSLEYEAVPLPESGVVLLIGDTNKPRGLVDSEYNTRRKECEEAVRILKQVLPDITALRDVTVEEFERHAHILPDVVCRRARHVITENDRVLQSITALKSGDIQAFGKLMNESHDSLRDDYEVTGPELDAMVDAARAVPGVFGARMTGAGFGGCTISLVMEESVEAFKQRVGAQYLEKTGLEATFHVCQASEGASRIR